MSINMGGCILRVARSAGDVFTDSSSSDIVISAIDGTSSSAILAGFTPAGGVMGRSLLRMDPTAGLVVHGNISVIGQILQGGSNVITGGDAPSTASGSSSLNTSNLVCSALTVTNTLTLGSNSVSFVNGSGSVISASTWNYMQNYVYSGMNIAQSVTRTLFTGVAQNHSAYIENGSVFVFGDNDHGQLGLGDLVNRPLPTVVPGVAGALAVACGQGYSVILLTNGTAVAMGNNAYGQLGDGTATDKHVPTPVLGVTTATAVVAGYSHTLFLLTSGVVVGYGSSSVGQLGAGTATVINTTLVNTTMPVASGSATPESLLCRAIDAGAYHSVLLLVNGTAYTFGQNTHGQLGLGNTTQEMAPTLVSQASVTKVVSIGAGQFHTLLVLYDGTVLSCGRNDSGQCGVGNVTTPLTAWTAVIPPPGSSNASAGLAVSVVAGAAHTVVKKADGTVWVFGSNTHGQLGAGVAVTSYLTPTQLLMSYAIYTAFAVAAGANHTVILLNNDPQQAQKNRIVACGDNTYGQVGTAIPGISTAFGPLPIFDGAMVYGKRLQTGCRSLVQSYVDTDGTAYIWGFNEDGEIGDGTCVLRQIPGAMAAFNFITGSTRLISMSGGSRVTAAIDSSGVVYTWGSNTHGQLGNNTTTASYIPIPISSFGSLSGRVVTSISLGDAHCIALDTTGAVHTWGTNSNMEIGNATTQDAHVPVCVSGNGSLSGRTAVAVSAGGLSCAVIDSTGQVHLWGYGTAVCWSPINDQGTPFALAGSLSGTQAVAVSSGWTFSLAIDTLGLVHSWSLDNGSGQLGNGTTNSQNPSIISNITNSSLTGKFIVTISCGDVHSLALDSTGTIHAWGANNSGQLGNGSSVNQLLPVAISGYGSLLGKTITAISGTYQHSMAMDSTGGIHVWGRGNEGQNGNNKTNDQNLPALLTLNSRSLNVPMFSHGGLGDTKLLKGRNTDLSILQSVGANMYGQVGDGTTTNRPNLVSLPSLPAPVTTCGSGLYHCGATLTDGTAYLWGRNNMGQCCGATQTNVLAPAAIPSVANAESVYCGSNCTFLTLLDGSVMALGDNTGNQLGLSSTIQSASNPSAVNGLTNIVQLASGGGSSIALNSSGNVYTWGTNTWGATGQGTLTGTTASPTLVNPVAWNSQRVSRIAAGDGVSALVTASGACYTCGVNTDGALGQATNFGTGCVSTFAQVSDPNNSYATGFGNAVVDVRCGARHTVLQLANNTIRVFGTNAGGQLSGVVGSGQWQPVTPVVNPSAPVVAVSASANSTLEEYQDRTTASIGVKVCGTQLMVAGGGAAGSTLVTPLGVIHHWGRTQNTTTSVVPVSLASCGSLTGAFITGVTGSDSIIATDQSGNVHSLGANSSGQLGNGTNIDTYTATMISNIKGSSLRGVSIVQVQVGFNHAVALDSTGALHVWGANNLNQLGDGTTNPRNIPIQIMSVSGSSLQGKKITSFAVGGRHTLAIDTNGGVHAWGYNDQGQIGNNSNSLQPVPIIISGNQGCSLYGNNIVRVAGGADHSMALDSNGGVHVWGDNWGGRLGTGDNNNRWLPVCISGNGSLSGNFMVSIAAGTCSIAIDRHGAVHQWGESGGGQLGTGNTNDQYLPVSPMLGALSGRNITEIAPGWTHVMALDAGGVVITWGGNSIGQVGCNNTIDQVIPLQISGVYGSLSSPSTTATATLSFTPFFVNFTGQHRVFVAGETVNTLGVLEGFIVVCDQNDYITATGSAPAGKFSRGQNAITTNDTLPVVSLSKTAYDERVFGVLSSSVFPFYPGMDQSEQVARRLVEVGDLRMEVNAVGSGAIWVCDSTGPLLSGSLVCSSGIPGYGMCQADPLPKVFQTFTVAKTTCDCDFTAPQQPVYEIKVDADGLNVLDGNGLPTWVACTFTQWTDSSGAAVTLQQRQQMPAAQQQTLRSSTVPAMESKYRMRWIQADGTLITQAQYNTSIASSTTSSSAPTVFRAAFIGCTYHCG